MVSGTIYIYKYTQKYLTLNNRYDIYNNNPYLILDLNYIQYIYPLSCCDFHSSKQI